MKQTFFSPTLAPGGVSKLGHRSRGSSSDQVVGRFGHGLDADTFSRRGELKLERFALRSQRNREGASKEI